MYAWQPDGPPELWRGRPDPTWDDPADQAAMVEDTRALIEQDQALAEESALRLIGKRSWWRRLLLRAGWG